MRVQAVRSRVDAERRERYLAAWAEWSGTLFPMGIETQLLEREDAPGRFLELTWFEEGNEAALGDDRLARIAADLDAAATDRQGALELYGIRLGRGDSSPSGAP